MASQPFCAQLKGTTRQNAMAVEPVGYLSYWQPFPSACEVLRKARASSLGRAMLYNFFNDKVLVY